MKLPKSESLILFAFLVCLFLWGISKCTARRSDLVRKFQDATATDADDRPVRRDTVVVAAPQQPTPLQQMPQKPAPAPAPIPAPTEYSSTLRKPGADPTPQSPKNETPASPTTASTTKSATTLYVSIDGLKVRKEPGLKGETLEQLPLYTPVTFLNQKTEWTQEISLGYEKVTDHWVKIRTATGKVGWEFGAGLHYYKTKRTGVVPVQPAAAKKKN